MRAQGEHDNGRVCCAEAVVNGYADRALTIINSQTYYGEPITINEQTAGYWAITMSDGYESFIKPIKTCAMTANFRVMQAKTPIFSEPSLKSPIITYLFAPALLEIARQDGDYGLVAGLGGYVFMRHLHPYPNREPISVAGVVAYLEQMLGLPYVWAGRCGNGFDCSGLIQTALTHFGTACPRDSKPQLNFFAVKTDETQPITPQLRDGDLVFWRGHVGLFYQYLLYHANGYHLAVVKEDFQTATTRMEAQGYPIIGIGRFLGAGL